ncbi:hypothetical protein GJ496_005906 [Pomphorhynchus laevis]|nr:hypothetical protein GJ496_005906 [Pomphorhynchus laevis]
MSSEKLDLHVEPIETIVFKGPLEREPLKSEIKLTNYRSKDIAFKIKVTAAQTYCVKPNNGVIQPGKTENVTIFLTGKKDLDNIEKHKFMIQYAFVDGKYSTDMWHSLHPSKLKGYKLGVTLLTGLPTITNEGSQKKGSTNRSDANVSPNPSVAMKMALSRLGTSSVLFALSPMVESDVLTPEYYVLIHFNLDIFFEKFS